MGTRARRLEEASPRVFFLIGCLGILLNLTHVTAQYAKQAYYMDASSDCAASGFWMMRSDDVVNVMSRRPEVSISDLLECHMQFRPEDTRDIMDVSFTDVTINEDDVMLTVALTGSQTVTLTAGSSKPDTMTSKGGLVTITLKRGTQDKNYYFGIILRVYKEVDPGSAADESPRAIGLIVGIVCGVIVFLVLICILGVCCYRKKKSQLLAHKRPNEFKADLAGNQMSPSHSYGIDNTARNGVTPPHRDRDSRGYEDESPRMKKKLLTQGFQPDYRDQSESESDTKDPYIIRNYDQSPTKKPALRYENERRDPHTNEVQTRRVTTHRPEANNRDQSQKALPPKSPVLAALHSNPRFRASFHAAEEEAQERARRGGGREGDDLDASMTETWNTTFDTNFDDDPRPPQGSFIKPPTLPPVPKSPKAPPRMEHTASIRRAPRPSSSSSEIEQLEGGVSMNPDGGHGVRPDDEGPPSPSEIVAIRVNDPHSPSTKRKADTQHTLRPDRKGKKKPPPEKNRKQQSGSDSPKRTRKDSESPETTRKESKPPKAESKKPKTNKTDSKATPSKSAADHEGRFKKADSARKSKGKSPRMGRSRSTGYALDDEDTASVRGSNRSKSKSPRLGRSRSTGHDLDDDASSIGGPSTPRGYRAVPRVTADDYEDSDMESNYNPLRRTGSKNSLYASRSSLYGRRRRRNSVGESVYSFAHDDLDRDRDSFKERSLSRRDRGFKSLGDLEAELREQSSRSTQTLRECATQTGRGFANVSPGKKTVVKRKKPRSTSNTHTQTAKSKERHLDTSSSSSGRSRERKNSASSAAGRSKSRDRKTSPATRPKRSRSQGELQQREEEEEFIRPQPPKTKPKPKPKPTAKPRKSTASAGHLSDDDLESVRTGMTGPIDQSSVISSIPGHMVGQPMYPPQGYPGYAIGYPPMGYVQATGQPPVMMPYGQPPAAVPMHMGAVAPNSAAVPNPGAAAPAKPSKWDMLCKMTDGESSQRGDFNETGSVAGSMYSNPYGAQYYPPGYSSAVSDYAGSEFSGPARSVTRQAPSSRMPKKSSWDALKEMTDQESQYAASESNV